MLCKLKKVDETMAGIINKITNGFVIPPVKYNKVPSCRRSYNKKIVEVKLLNWFSFILNCK